MENENLDIFNLNLEDFQVETTSKGNGLYKPDPKNGKDNIYRAVVHSYLESTIQNNQQSRNSHTG